MAIDMTERDTSQEYCFLYVSIRLPLPPKAGKPEPTEQQAKDSKFINYTSACMKYVDRSNNL